MKYILIILILITSLKCGVIINKKLFTAKPSETKIDDTKLKLDGLYIGEVVNNNKKGLIIFSFYNNGIAVENYLMNENSIYGSGDKFNKLKILDSIKYIDSIYKGIKQAGGYEIVNHKIQIQVFEFVNYGNFELTSYQGNIINDTTIFINSCLIKSGSNFCPENFSVSYLQLNKPDSTHQLMKRKWYWEN